MKGLIACLCMACLFVASAGATDRYVSTNGNNTPPFDSWTTAATTITGAVNAANAANAMDTVWITNGTYVLSATVFVTNTIVRGFSGDPSDVIVNGNGSVRGFYMNHANAVVQDLTISNGMSSVDPSAGMGGGACVAKGTLNHCVLVNNAVTADTRGGGAGAYCASTGSLISNCVFATNNAKNYSGMGAGGGLRMDNGLAVDCLFSNNVAYSHGGGAFLAGGGILSNSTFIGNSTVGGGAVGGGGVYVITGVVANCLISSNTGQWAGGGAYLAGTNAVLMNSTCVLNYSGNSGLGGGGVYLNPGRMTHCVLSNNASQMDTRGGGGGAYCTTAAGSLITDCVFVANNAKNYSGMGAGGGLRMDNGLAVNCLFSNNTAVSHGGGVYMVNGGILSNCTLVGNNGGSTAGGGIYVLTGRVANCLIFTNVSAQNGGGAYLAGTNAILMNCTSSWNSAGASGGGAYINYGMATNCVINNNYAVSGGGIYMAYTSTVANCVITSNASSNASTGGGIYCGALNGLVVNCQIMFNKSFYGGGFSFAAAARGALVQNCNISSNTITGASSGSGGGVYAYNGSSGLLLDKCTISGNSGWCRGGGVYFYLSASTAQNCRITGNIAGGQTYDTGGGAVLYGAGTLIDCLIANNVVTNGSHGGGVGFLGNGGAMIVNCTVVSNNATTGHGGGLAFGTAGGSLPGTGVVVNCIVYGNKSATANDYNWYYMYSGSAMFATNSCIATTNYSTSYVFGTGNVTNDPLFVNAPSGDYHLAPLSPCIDKGLTQAWMYGVTDLDGRQRVQGGMVDMGAYEYVPSGTLIMMR